MKKTVVILAALLCFFLLCAGCVLAEPSVSVEIMAFNNGEDNLSFGYIQQTVIVLDGGEPVQIVMDEVFNMYPAHSGVYGVLLADGDVTLTPSDGDGQATSGSGVLEFSFPGATGCTLTGDGTVYAYFLPVPYLRLSSDVSLVYQAFDTSYLTETAVGHQNMFILTDPHYYIFQEGIPMPGTVYKYSTNLGEIPAQYAQFAPNEIVDCLFPFLYDTPVLVQCDALTIDVYQGDNYIGRPMALAVQGEAYEIWCFRDYAPTEGVFERISQTFEAALDYGYEHVLPEGRSIDTVLMVMLGEEVNRAHATGIAVSERLMDRIGFQNYVLYDVHSWKNASDYLYFLCAHEIGHIVQAATLSVCTVSSTNWINEGFADYFAEKVCARMGIDYHEPHSLSADDAQRIEVFNTNMVFGVNNWQTFKAASDSGTLLEPSNIFSFGYFFMRYLEDVYGEDFYKGISEQFYLQYYQGYEESFFFRGNSLDYYTDTYFKLFRSGLGEDVYLNYPAYAQDHYLN